MYKRQNEAKALANKNKDGVYNTMKKSMEVNPYHPFIRELLERVKSEVDTETERRGADPKE